MSALQRTGIATQQGPNRPAHERNQRLIRSAWPAAKRRWKPFAAAVIAAGLMASSATAAVAAPLPTEGRESALWHVNTWFELNKLQEAGATGQGITIAVIDGVLNPDVPELAGANLTVKGSACADPSTGEPMPAVSQDPAIAEHATNVVSMIIGNGTAADGGAGARGLAPEAEVWFYGVGPLDGDVESCVAQDPTHEPNGIDLAHDIRLDRADSEEPRVLSGAGIDGDLDPTALAARAAIRDGADIISVSVASGDRQDWDQVLVEAQLAGVAVVGSTRNPDYEFQIGTEYGGPWSTNGAVPVSAIDQNGDALEDTATGATGVGSPMLAFAAPGRGLLGVATDSAWEPTTIAGTSMATPLVAASIALVMQAGDAMAFQALQALVHTTGAGSLHDPERLGDLFGYGYANPRGAIAANPASFPDTNPMFVERLEDGRCNAPDGSVGQLIDGSAWYCHWSPGPFPPAVEAYQAVVSGEARATDDYGAPVSSPYDEAAAGATQVSGMPAWAMPVLIGTGAVVLLGIVATAIIVPIMISRSRKKASRGL